MGLLLLFSDLRRTQLRIAGRRGNEEIALGYPFGFWEEIPFFHVDLGEEKND